mgnify:FL=1
MSYTSWHKAVAVAVSRSTVEEITPGKVRKVIVGVGTVDGYFEDTSGKVVYRQAGVATQVTGRVYAGASEDVPVLRGDLVAFADPYTGEARSLVVLDRRGPFDPTDDEDHFELDLGVQQAG